jgi:hypothetical protein
MHGYTQYKERKIASVSSIKTTIKQKRVFVSFYGVCEENNQQNTNFARLKKIS